jgi:hypothetical protein
MKPVSWDKQLGLASPLKCAAIQSGKIKSPSNKEAGLDVSHHALVSREGRGENFFLDILFHKMSEMATLREAPVCPSVFRSGSPLRRRTAANQGAQDTPTCRF